MNVYQPQARVLLIKSRRRESMGDSALRTPANDRFGEFAGADITSFLAESGGLRTAKAVHEPAGGFSLVLEDRPLLGESLYGLIEPMDVIEIRLAHTPSPRGQALPLVMRGLVSSVSRSEAMANGQPQRLVTVTGQDFGKLLQTLRIYYLPGSVVGEVWLDQFKFFRQFDMDTRQKGAAEWLAEMTTNVITPYMQKLLTVADGRALGANVPRELVAQCWVRGTVSPIGIASFYGGSVHDLLRQFLDVGPFNELFVEDREDQLALVCRPAPWRRLDGSYVEEGAWSETARVSDGEVLALTVSRTDSGVANFYWVSNRRWELVNNASLKQLAVTGSTENYLLHEYENARADLYGVRTMEVETALGGPGASQAPAPRGGKAASDQQIMGTWLDERRRVLAEANRDNVVLEQGSMRLFGRPDLRAGMHIELTRAGVTSTCYAVRVEHEFLPGQGFFTSVTFERGTGFVERASRVASPWLAELDLRGVV